MGKSLAESSNRGLKMEIENFRKNNPLETVDLSGIPTNTGI